MWRKATILTLLMLLACSVAWALYDYELGHYRSQGFVHRLGAEMDDFIEHGPAMVSHSPRYEDGIRLNAGSTEEPALATAIYLFKVPQWTTFLKITVRYHDYSEDNEIAARLWVKSVEEEKEAKETEEEIFYGDTFVLPSDQLSESIYVPPARYLEDGRLELHIVAEGSDVIDVKSVRIDFLKEEPEVKVVYRYFDDYWNSCPPRSYVYHYYYCGPYYWPRSSLYYECWGWPWEIYWSYWRPHFRFSIGLYFNYYPHWYRRYTRLYDCHGYTLVERRRRIHHYLRDHSTRPWRPVAKYGTGSTHYANPHPAPKYGVGFSDYRISDERRETGNRRLIYEPVISTHDRRDRTISPAVPMGQGSFDRKLMKRWEPHQVDGSDPFDQIRSSGFSRDIGRGNSDGLRRIPVTSPRIETQGIPSSIGRSTTIRNQPLGNAAPGRRGISSPRPAIQNFPSGGFAGQGPRH